MSATLTALITRIQTRLIDDGTRFSTALCTEAVRTALGIMNQRVPVHAADRIDVVSGQKEYEISDADSRCIGIIDVLEYDTETDAQDDHTPLPYDKYTEDERWFIRLRTALDDGELLVRYEIPHTIQGLDSAVSSTLTAEADEILMDGACWKALTFRGPSRIETINLQREVARNYAQAVEHFQRAFEIGLQSLARARRSAVAEERTDAWQEPYYSWDI